LEIPVRRRRYKPRTNGNGCPVPLCGTGRYNSNTKCNFKDARLKAKAGGRYKFKIIIDCEEPARRRRYKPRTNGNGCPVPLCGTGRYNSNTKCNFKDARLKGKSRRPLQIQNHHQLRRAGGTPALQT